MKGRPYLDVNQGFEYGNVEEEQDGVGQDT